MHFLKFGASQMSYFTQSKDLGSNPSAVESVIFSTERFSDSLKYYNNI